MGLAAFTWRPGVGRGAGTNLYDLAYVSDGSVWPAHHVIHAYGTWGQTVAEEDLGGWADERAGCGASWSADGNNFSITCVGSGGQMFVINWSGSWSGWMAFSTGKNYIVPLLPTPVPGPKGDQGPPGKDGAGITPAVTTAVQGLGAAYGQLSGALTPAGSEDK